MFIGEVGIDPPLGDGGRGYRRRVAALIAAGRAWARFEHGEVIFKAEVGSESPAVGQVQGCLGSSRTVRNRPGHRGHGGAGRCSGVRRPHRRLYVNSFNTIARAAYAKVGFTDAGTFATVLLD